MKRVLYLGTGAAIVVLAGAAVLGAGLAPGPGHPARSHTSGGNSAGQPAQNSGAPDPVELAVLNQRQRVFVFSAGLLKLLVYPPSVGGKASPDDATNLAELIDAQKLTRASSTSQDPGITVKRGADQLKALWRMARRFSAFLQQAPPDAQYALYAQYLVERDPAGAQKFHAVYFVVCDRYGHLAIVDSQTDRDADFQALNPQSGADCDRLVVKRLETYFQPPPPAAPPPASPPAT